MGSDTPPTVARCYHEATAYRSVGGLLAMGEPPTLKQALGRQDPAIRPPVYKDTSELDGIVLPREPSGTALSALDALAGTGAGAGPGDTVPDLTQIARLGLWSNGVFRRVTRDGRPLGFRCYSCAGGLYHLELYFVCADVPGLSAGVYHYSAQDHTFRRVREGDHRATVVAATGHEPATATAPVVVVCTSTFWRNAWRYRDRSYRHALWDAGTLSATFAAVAASEGLPLRVVTGFADRTINDLVGADGEREAALALFAVGRSSIPVPDAPHALPLLPSPGPLPGEIDHPWITRVHQASALDSGAEARAWRSIVLDPTDAAGERAEMIPLAPGADEKPATGGIVDLLTRRRSHRFYDTRRSLPFDRFSVVVDQATRGLPIEALDSGSSVPFTPFLVVNSVDGLRPGTYVAHPDAKAIELIGAGDRRAEAMVAACHNGAARDAHVNLYGIVELDPFLHRFGDRGYRLLQLAAGMFAGRLQLVAHAVDLGAMALTSIDGKVAELFRVAGSSYLIGTTFGHHQNRDGRPRTT